MSKKTIFLATIAISNFSNGDAWAMDAEKGAASLPREQEITSVPSATHALSPQTKKDKDHTDYLLDYDLCDLPYKLSPEAKEAIKHYNGGETSETTHILGVLSHICTMDLNVIIKPEQCAASFKKLITGCIEKNNCKLIEEEVEEAMTQFIHDETEAILTGKSQSEPFQLSKHTPLTGQAACVMGEEI